jgi:triosephosphate isomerase (TIM)
MFKTKDVQNSEASNAFNRRGTSLNSPIMASSKRQKMVAGNWKMNKNMPEALALAEAINAKELPKDVAVVLCPPSVCTASVGTIIANNRTVHLGAQNCHHEISGAYTGEVAADMLKSVEVAYVIVGHSERREYQNETSEMLVKKINLLLEREMTPIYCCGEPLKIREKGTHAKHVAKQIKAELFHLSEEEVKKIVIAYEPIWAIGTGLTASPEQAQEMHAEIRKVLARQYGKRVANMISILYGGSCNASNAKSIFSQPDVDGGLIGGASLKADDFATIIGSFDN